MNPAGRCSVQETAVPHHEIHCSDKLAFDLRLWKRRVQMLVQVQPTNRNDGIGVV
jgi:hypothetical protein